ncbi:hypothetical protein EKK58_09995 [Candidatus Dependentiae bacterium]|nr:MAG: hypothetical protein EKK58_09995 [Candidatus Dependentiae bacterium]
MINKNIEGIKKVSFDNIGNCKNCVFSEIDISTDYDNIKRIHVLCHARPSLEDITRYIGNTDKSNADILNDFKHGCGMFKKEE